MYLTENRLSKNEIRSAEDNVQKDFKIQTLIK